MKFISTVQSPAPLVQASPPEPPSTATVLLAVFFVPFAAWVLWISWQWRKERQQH